MNYPPYDPNNPHAGQYPPTNPVPPLPQPTGLEAKFNLLPGWGRWGLIGLSGSLFVGTLLFLLVLINSALGSPLPIGIADTPTMTPVPMVMATMTPTPVLMPTSQSIHYPPTTGADLRALAAKGDANAIHPFHSESVGLTGVCPQPKSEVTVDPSVTGQQLAEDLLAYFYAQQLDSPCGSLVLAYHNQGEVNDADTGGTYTAGLINFDVTDASGQINSDPNANNLKHKLTLDIGLLGTNQEYIVTY